MTDQRRAELRLELDALLTDASRSLAELIETVGIVRSLIWQLECERRALDDDAHGDDTTEPAAPADTE